MVAFIKIDSIESECISTFFPTTIHRFSGMGSMFQTRTDGRYCNTMPCLDHVWFDVFYMNDKAKIKMSS